MVSKKKNSNPDEEFQWDKSLGKPVPFCHPLTELEWIAAYLKSLSESDLINTIKEYFSPELVATLAKTLGV